MALTQFDYTQTASLGATFLGMGRNRIINGGMDIDQARGGGAVTINSTTQQYGVDMFLAEGQSADGVFTMQRLDNPGVTGQGFQKALRFTVTTADASVGAAQIYGFQTRLEGFTTKDFLFGTASAKTLTLSFWIRSSLTGTFGLGILNSASNRSYVANYTINAANTWEQKTITFAGDTTGTWGGFSGMDMYIEWDLGSGSNFEQTAGSWQAAGKWRSSGNTRFISTNAATLDITGVQLEIGSTATPFEYRPYGDELRMCKRYFISNYGRDVAPGTNTQNGDVYFTGSTDENGSVSVYTIFPVEMRATPTFIFYQTNGTVGSWTYRRSGVGTSTFTPSGAHATQSSVDIISQNLGATFVSAWIEGHWVADARL